MWSLSSPHKWEVLDLKPLVKFPLFSTRHRPFGNEMGGRFWPASFFFLAVLVLDCPGFARRIDAPSKKRQEMQPPD
jgi:hypothetical protein